MIVGKEEKTNKGITHQVIEVIAEEKLTLLLHHLTKFGKERGIIFCRTKAGAQNLATYLIEEGFSTAALEGDMQQKERDKVMRAFKKENLQYLVSTDVSARGIDVRGLEFVIHHQLPEQLEYYTHRSGRTARAGKTGVSIAFILPSELEKIHQIQKDLNIKFSEVTV